MTKMRYLLAAALLLAVMVLAACTGVSSTGSGTGTDTGAPTVEAGAAPNVPASDATVTAEAATDTGAEANATPSPESDAGEGTGDTEGGAGDETGDTSGEASATPSPESDAGDGTGDDTGAGGDNAQAPGTTNTLAYTAVSDAECSEVQDQLAEALAMEVTRSPRAVAFQDLTGGAGESCQLSIHATGVEFPNLGNAAGRIAEFLTANGWEPDPQYAADSPIGTIAGLRRGNQLAVYHVEWMPGAAVTCPADQPIAVCAESLSPDQIIYNVTIDLAQQ